MPSSLRALPPLLLGSTLFVTLWLARVDRSGTTRYGFLLWNLVLAWVPMFAAWLVHLCLQPDSRTGQRRAPRAAAAFAVMWLAFLPNAPYVITDLVHLRPRSPIPLWYDALMLGDAALVGLLSGGMSLRVVTGALARLHRRARYAVPMLAIPAAGVGITLGRFERLNSWELFTNPTRVLDALSHLLSLRSLVVSGTAAGLLCVVYLALEPTIGAPRPSSPGGSSKRLPTRLGAEAAAVEWRGRLADRS